MNIIIRQELKEDHNRIKEINDQAFEQEDEGRLVNKLRRKAQFIPELSLVAEVDETLVGHILLYPAKIISAHQKHTTLSLGPMSVLPEYQKKGIGGKLINEGLKRSKDLGFLSVIVVGHPEYYPKFGFTKASRWSIKVPFDVPDEVFMALEIVEGELQDKSGIIEYPAEFMEM
jgi:predicted N-acetyltransferase YhbS